MSVHSAQFLFKKQTLKDSLRPLVGVDNHSRSLIAFMISSAHLNASAIALTVAGIRLPPSNCASLRAARMLDAIRSIGKSIG
jgi:hypothetical protein